MAEIIRVTKLLTPPSRLEGGGFEIRDIMSGVSTEEQDPFLVPAVPIIHSKICFSYILKILRSGMSFRENIKGKENFPVLQCIAIVASMSFRTARKSVAEIPISTASLLQKITLEQLARSVQVKNQKHHPHM